VKVIQRLYEDIEVQLMKTMSIKKVNLLFISRPSENDRHILLAGDSLKFCSIRSWLDGEDFYLPNRERDSSRLHIAE